MRLDEVDNKLVEDLVRLDAKLECPYLIGAMSGAAAALMAVGISSSYCTYSMEEVFYAGLILFLVCCGVAILSAIQQARSK